MHRQFDLASAFLAQLQEAQEQGASVPSGVRLPAAAYSGLVGVGDGSSATQLGSHPHALQACATATHARAGEGGGNLCHPFLQGMPVPQPHMDMLQQYQLLQLQQAILRQQLMHQQPAPHQLHAYLQDEAYRTDSLRASDRSTHTPQVPQGRLPADRLGQPPDTRVAFSHGGAGSLQELPDWHRHPGWYTSPTFTQYMQSEQMPPLAPFLGQDRGQTSQHGIARQPDPWLQRQPASQASMQQTISYHHPLGAVSRVQSNESDLPRPPPMGAYYPGPQPLPWTLAHSASRQAKDDLKRAEIVSALERNSHRRKEHQVSSHADGSRRVEIASPSEMLYAGPHSGEETRADKGRLEVKDPTAPNSLAIKVECPPDGDIRYQETGKLDIDSSACVSVLEPGSPACQWSRVKRRKRQAFAGSCKSMSHEPAARESWHAKDHQAKHSQLLLHGDAVKTERATELGDFQSDISNGDQKEQGARKQAVTRTSFIRTKDFGLCSNCDTALDITRCRKTKHGKAICVSCSAAYDQGQYCVKCDSIWLDSDMFKGNWIYCDECAFWMHSECIKLPFSVFQKATQDKDSKFYCPSCQGEVAARGVETDKYGFVSASKQLRRAETSAGGGSQGVGPSPLRPENASQRQRLPGWVTDLILVRSTSPDDKDALSNAIRNALSPELPPQLQTDLVQAIGLVDTSLERAKKLIVASLEHYCNVNSIHLPDKFEEVGDPMDLCDDVFDVICGNIKGSFAVWGQVIFCMCPTCLGLEPYKPKQWIRHVGAEGSWKDVILCCESKKTLGDWLRSRNFRHGAVRERTSLQRKARASSSREEEDDDLARRRKELLSYRWPGDRCSVCWRIEDYESNKLCTCNVCHVTVHQYCYGYSVTQPASDGSWTCTACKYRHDFQEASSPRCILCPIPRGPLKPTEEKGKWAHSSCVFHIEETYNDLDIGSLEPVCGIKRIPKSRWNLQCYLCGVPEGACIQCQHKGCYAAFHVTCAQFAGLPVSSEFRTVDGVEGWYSTAFCEKHSPADHKKGSRQGTEDLDPEHEIPTPDEVSLRLAREKNMPYSNAAHRTAGNPGCARLRPYLRAPGDSFKQTRTKKERGTWTRQRAMYLVRSTP